jgi:hypothetical protein
MKMTVFWDVMSCSLTGFGETCCLHLQATLKTAVAGSSETLIIYQITRHHVSDYSHLQIIYCIPLMTDINAVQTKVLNPSVLHKMFQIINQLKCVTADLSAILCVCPLVVNSVLITT